MANNAPNNNATPWSRGLRGMQVHAVPESDKAFDAQGRKLPWAYSLDPSAASAALANEPVEKGPFGRSQRRSRSGLSRSRSKTAEPSTNQEKAQQLAAEDAVFGSLRKRDNTNEDAGRGRNALGEIDGNTIAGAQQGIGKEGMKGEQEATEVMLFGFGEELQWAAIDHFERVSGGAILEDYDRLPSGSRFDSARSFGRAGSAKSLSRAALLKKNTFAGGLHWIKITFDSREAADLACARSPHIIKGHLVYAEPYLGRGPGKDEAIPASQAGAQINDSILPATFSTNTLLPSQASPSGSSTTASSATATTTQRQRQLPQSQSTPTLASSYSPSSSTTLQNQPENAITTSSQSSAPDTTSKRKVQGAIRPQLMPVNSALMPKPPKQSWSAWLGAGEVIGTTVPRKDDGSFDYDRAGLWWRTWYWVDWALGTDWCGLKAD